MTSTPVHPSPAVPPAVVLQGDTRNLSQVLDEYNPRLPAITCTITSPPYWNLKDYGDKRQIGHGGDYPVYLAEIRKVFATLKERSTERGSLWLVADTLQDLKTSPSKTILLPFDLVREAESVGWILRDIVIWRKDRTLPWASRGRLRNVFEYVLLMVAGREFKYYADRLRSHQNLSPWWVQYPERYHPLGKLPTNVWDIPIPVQGSWSTQSVRHSCPLPPDLVERMIVLSSEPGDLVVDPFAGVGTVPAEAERLSRQGLGVELDSAHVKKFRDEVRPQLLVRGARDAEVAEDVKTRELTIARLRALKYPKALSRAYKKLHPDGLQPRASVVLLDLGAEVPPSRSSGRLVFVADGTEEERAVLLNRLALMQRKKPFSLYQVNLRLEVLDARATAEMLQEHTLYLYEHGRTWASVGVVDRGQFLASAPSTKVGRYLPIAANVALKETAHRPYA